MLVQTMEQQQPSYTARGNVNDEAILEEFGSSLKHPMLNSPNDPATSLLISIQDIGKRGPHTCT